MNQQMPHPPRPSTQAAEGLPRRSWTLEEFDRFIEPGIIDADDKVGLVGREIVNRPARVIAHDDVVGDLEDWLVEALPEYLRIAAGLPCRPDKDT